MSLVDPRILAEQVVEAIHARRRAIFRDSMVTQEVIEQSRRAAVHEIAAAILSERLLLSDGLRMAYAVVKRAFVSRGQDQRWTTEQVNPSAMVRIKGALREHIAKVLQETYNGTSPDDAPTELMAIEQVELELQAAVRNADQQRERAKAAELRAMALERELAVVQQVRDIRSAQLQAVHSVLIGDGCAVQPGDLAMTETLVRARERMAERARPLEADFKRSYQLAAGERIGVEICDTEGHYTVFQGSTGLTHTKSATVALLIARALRAIFRIDVVSHIHGREALGKVGSPAPVMTPRIYPDGITRCICQLCIIARDEQEP